MKKRIRWTKVGPSLKRERGEVFSSSIKVLLRKNRKHKDGSCDIQIRIIINRESTKMNLGFRWLEDYWDEVTGFCKPRFKGDTQANDHNLEIRAAIGKANDILLHYRISHRSLSLDQFRKEYLNYFNRASFIDFMSSHVEYRKNQLSHGTYTNHKLAMVKIMGWRPNLMFSDLNKTTPQQFDAYLRKQYDNINTIFKFHRVFRTYINEAIKLGHDVPGIYKGFRFHSTPSKNRALSEEEVAKVIAYYNECEKEEHRRVLRRFIWSLLTSMRISDQMRIDPSWVVDGRLIYVPQKTQRTGKIININLPATAVRIFKEELAITGGVNMFRFPARQVGNRCLSRIGEKLGLGTKLTSHIGRKTCATLVVKHLGDLHAAKEYLGHSDIRTTMAYDNVDEQRKQAAANVLERAVGDKLKDQSH
ncbi:MAG: site-specific integrase [Sphingobacteriaceae bacterium]|nr:site-specific integrase [Sphingobacteriaceae bacterium]